MRSHIAQTIRARPQLAFVPQALIGSMAGAAATTLRLCMPLNAQQLPTITVIIAIALATTFVGTWAGVFTALVGGGLSWYFLFMPIWRSLPDGASIPLIGFVILATTIVSTASLYRSSERRWHDREVTEADRKAEDALLFAREMSHRLKNALAIVQSLTFQTVGQEDPKALALAARLKTLADANDLLTEHISEPVAKVGAVIRTALAPFPHEGRLRLALADADLADSQVVNLALALHELATNSTKYGSWSQPGGHVDLSVHDAGLSLRLTWNELGGPRPSDELIEGFGSRLLQRAGRNAVFRLQPTGLEYSVELRKAR